MKKHGFTRALLTALWLLAAPFAGAAEQRFDITRFEVGGNTLLPAAEVERLTAPFVGSNRNYGDVQKALEALENAYRRAGYGAVHVYVPEQELLGGVVRIEVEETVLGKVSITGNKYFDDANVRAALPTLQEGRSPNLRELSENVQLANENAARQLEVVLGVADKPGEVNANVAVTDENPQKVFLTLDNTGTEATGKLRMGVAYQHANLGGHDETLVLAYTGSPDKPSGVEVDIYSLALRLPFYALGDSLDIIYGNSNVNTPSFSPSLGGSPLGLVGKGWVAALRWNHHFARQGEYASRLVFGFDQKYANSRCSVGGVKLSIDSPNGAGAGCTPYTTRPLSLTYVGQLQGPGEAIDFSVGALRNVPIGRQYAYTAQDGGATGVDRYSMVAQNRQVSDDFSAFKLSGSYLRLLPAEWMLRAAFTGQYSSSALPSLEQISLAGPTAVRGFEQWSVSADRGYVTNLELYTPELAGRIGVPGSLKFLGFFDYGYGHNYGAVNSQPTSQPPANASIASVGLGLRYALGKDASLKADFARIMDAGPVDATSSTAANNVNRGDWYGLFALQVGF